MTLGILLGIWVNFVTVNGQVVPESFETSIVAILVMVVVAVMVEHTVRWE